MNRYWVGGTGNWNDTSHWSASSGGSGGASVPTSNDDVFIDANSGVVTILLDSDIVVNNFNGVFSVNNTVFDTGGFNITMRSFKWGSKTTDSVSPSIFFRGSTVMVSTRFDITNSAVRIDFGTSSIYLTGVNNELRYPNIDTMNKLYLQGITNNVFTTRVRHLELLPGLTLKSFGNRGFIISESLVAVGTESEPITIYSTDAQQIVFSKPSGFVQCDYLVLADSRATGGAKWYAGENSIDNGGNEGWIFRKRKYQLPARKV